MRPRRVRAADLVAGAGGLALAGSLAAREPAPATAALALLAAPPVALPILQATRRAPALPVAASVLSVLTGLVAAPLAAWRAVRRPAPVALARLAAATAVLAGGWWSMTDEHVPGAVPPDVPRRPTPPAGA